MVSMKDGDNVRLRRFGHLPGTRRRSCFTTLEDETGYKRCDIGSVF
jgi:hypothetical protein